METFLVLIRGITVILNILVVLLCPVLSFLAFRSRERIFLYFGGAQSERKRDAQLRCITLIAAPLILAGITLFSLLYRHISVSPSPFVTALTTVCTMIPVAAAAAVVLRALHEFLQGGKNGEQKKGLKS